MANEKTRMIKVLGFGGSGDNLTITDLSSRQLVADPFAEMAAYGTTLVKPPYSLEQLVYLAESYPTHGAAIGQKTSDTIGDGPKFLPAHEGADKEAIADVQRWWNSLADEYTTVEVLNALWDDMETMAWGIFEATRDVNGVVRNIYYVPGQTVRAHRDGIRMAQEVQGRAVWFKRWGVEDDFYYSSGYKGANIPADKRASELVVFRRPTRRSAWYGVPSYISAVGHISMGIASRDYNIMFFENSREPRHLIVITGLDEEIDSTVDEIATQLAQLYKDPHRNIILPVTGDASVTIEKMGTQQNDMHFAKLIDVIDNAILLAHRIPPDRLGSTKRGYLGGNVANVMNRIYRDAVVSPNQIILENRLTKFIAKEYALARGMKAPADFFKLDFERIDVSDELNRNTVLMNDLRNDMITINEARVIAGIPYDAKFEDYTLTEWRQLIKTGSDPTKAANTTNSAGSDDLLNDDTIPDNNQLSDEVVQKLLSPIIEKLDEHSDLLDSLVLR